MGIRPSRVWYGYASRNDRRVLLAGLDGAGKTALLNVLMHGELRPSAPTSTTRVETVKVDWANLQVWDVGGREYLRPYWRHYYTGTQGVVFVVDATDFARLDAAAAELAAMAADDQLTGVPILIISNKADAPGALVRDALLSRLGLAGPAALAGHAWELHLCNGVPSRETLKPGLDFLLRSMRRL